MKMFHWQFNVKYQKLYRVIFNTVIVVQFNCYFYHIVDHWHQQMCDFILNDIQLCSNTIWNLILNKTDMTTRIHLYKILDLCSLLPWLQNRNVVLLGFASFFLNDISTALKEHALTNINENPSARQIIHSSFRILPLSTFWCYWYS